MEVITAAGEMSEACGSISCKLRLEMAKIPRTSPCIGNAERHKEMKHDSSMTRSLLILRTLARSLFLTFFDTEHKGIYVECTRRVSADYLQHNVQKAKLSPRVGDSSAQAKKLPT
jgi:hypothetical protein